MKKQEQKFEKVVEGDDTWLIIGWTVLSIATLNFIAIGTFAGDLYLFDLGSSSPIQNVIISGSIVIDGIFILVGTAMILRYFTERKVYWRKI